MRTANILCHTFLPEPLRNSRIAIDCGANHGGFSRWLSQNTTAEIYAFEPDPRLFKELPALPRVTYFQLAIDGASGEFDLALGESNCSSAVYREDDKQQTIKVKKISLDEFCQSKDIQQVDFIKIDIEGAELSLLEETSDTLLEGTKQITVEFHDFLRKEDRPRIRKIFHRMKRLGFHSIRFSIFSWGDCLFLNQRWIQLSLLDRIRLQLLGRFLPGMQRFMKRKIHVSE